MLERRRLLLVGISDSSLPIAFYRNLILLALSQLKGMNTVGVGSLCLQTPGEIQG